VDETSKSPKETTVVKISGVLSSALVAGVVLAGGPLQGQTRHSPADSVTVVPADYCASTEVYAYFAGKGYRSLWTTPLRVPVADLDVLGGGGLEPRRVGGGMTTQTLHLSGADGRRYVFRSVQKVTRQALAEEFWGTPVEDIMRDQLCSFQPSGAVVVAPLLEAVGVLHPKPQLLVVPDDPRLGEFREQFAGMFVLFEERPDDGPDGTEGFGGSRQIVSTEDLFDELEAHPRDRVEGVEFLKSRLVDLLVGDRDRSINNHLWARFDMEDGGHLWRPIPRDRDQAFVRFDGVIKSIGRIYDPRLVSFEEDFSHIGGLTRNAWDLDRNLLVALDRERWDSVVVEVAARITDEVIDDAVGRLPPEHFLLIGPELASGLRHRRDRLGEAAEALFGIVFEEADLHATDDDEEAVLERLDGGAVGVTIVPREEGASPNPVFRRTFYPSETKELRLYMHGGDDLIRVMGDEETPISLKIIGGGGDDSVTLSSQGMEVTLFDDGEETTLSGEGGRWDRREAHRPHSWWVDGEETPDFGAKTIPELGFGYDGDRGLVLSAGFKRDRYGFLMDPYKNRVKVRGGWAVGRGEPIVDLQLQGRSVLFGGDLLFRGRYSGFEVVRFYGLGNQTREDSYPEYYKVHQKQLVMAGAVSFGDGENREFSLGPTFKRIASDTTDPSTFVTESRYYGTGTFQQAGLQASLELDERDVSKAPTRGFHLSGGASFYPALLDVEDPFGEAHGAVAGYWTPESVNPTLAGRVGGKKLWGDFPYSEAAFLGGASDVRGLREQRYAGDASVYASAELRVFLTRFFFLFPTDLGIFGLTDVGRVYQDGESSGDVHTSVGGGVWLAPLTRDSTVRLSLARSGGRTAFYGGMGFAF
jgi:hypothetical protein